jgi:hypothetical protein
MQKVFDKIQYAFIIEILHKLGIERSCFNVIKAIYDKPIAK